MRVIDHLFNRIDELSCPIVVGLDPVIQHIPAFIKEKAVENFGNTINGAAEALFDFNRGLLESLYQRIPAVKLQMACYELYGSCGMTVYQRTVQLAKELGLLVIDDAKRNDVGNTAELYAVGHLGKPPLIDGEDHSVRADFMTINPYLGSDAINPFVEACKKHDKGLFVLVRTSNPSSREYQEATINGMALYQKIAGDVDRFGRDLVGESGYSSIGAVVGATWPEEASLLRDLMPTAYFLVPGYGAQGATADNVVHAFDKNGHGALINSSRNVIFAYQDKKYRNRGDSSRAYAQIALDVVIEMNRSIQKALSDAGKLPKNWQIDG